MKVDRKKISKRAGIEGTNSALKQQAKLNVRGKARNTMVSALRVTAQNISRLIKYIQGGYKPKVDNMPQQGIISQIQPNRAKGQGRGHIGENIGRKTHVSPENLNKSPINGF
jgi:hypothetical protein